MTVHRTSPRRIAARAWPAVALLLLTAACTLVPGHDRGPLRYSGPTGHNMVSVANPHAAEAAFAVLQRGGNALDAAVAAQMVLTLVEPQSSGIGGGGFLLYLDAGAGTVTAYDGRETAPAAATPSMFLKPDGTPLKFYDAVVGGLSVGVPGVLAMLDLAHRDHGRLPWKELFGDAVRLAEDGFEISPRLAALIAADEYLATQPRARSYFYLPDGQPKTAGTRLRNPALARTLTAIAEDGAGAFYGGPLARDLVETVRTAYGPEGLMTTDDLKAYRALARQPLCRPYRAWVVCGMPPPTSGGIAVLQILGILEAFDLDGLAPNSAEAAHLIAEASRLAFADRNRYVADADFVQVPVDALLDRAYLRDRADLIDPARAMEDAEPGDLAGQAAMASQNQYEPPSTTHLAIVDADGNAVSFTSSVENAFGSRHMVGGFILNNQLTDFSFRPEADGRPVANRVAPGKRPRSSMSPTLVFDRRGRLVMAIGSPGGSRIPGYTLKAIVGTLDWGLDMQAAIALPNLTNRDGPTDLEEGTALETIAPVLEAMGHEVRLQEMTSGLHGILIRDGVPNGGADPRREGVVLGN